PEAPDAKAKQQLGETRSSYIAHMAMAALLSSGSARYWQFKSAARQFGRHSRVRLAFLRCRYSSPRPSSREGYERSATRSHWVACSRSHAPHEKTSGSRLGPRRKPFPSGGSSPTNERPDPLLSSTH